jgi:hypothetical protein
MPMTLSQLLEQIEITIEKEVAIRNKSPDKIPLNPTAQGWSGQMIRAAMAEALIGQDSLLGEMKSKMALIKEAFQVLVEDQRIQFRVTPEYLLQYKLLDETDWTNIINLVEVMGNIVFVGTEEPSEPREDSLWFDTN